MDNKTLYDNRALYDYESKYPDSRPSKWQKNEAIYLGVSLLLSFILILLNYLDILYDVLRLISDSIDYELCKKLCYCALFGFLGGLTFDIKFFYRSIARGFWNEDRVYWRIFSPWLSIALALVMSAVLNKAIIESNAAMSICVGFFSGYFSDDAIAKMHDVAQVIFSRTKSDSENDINDSSINDGEQK